MPELVNLGLPGANFDRVRPHPAGTLAMSIISASKAYQSQALVRKCFAAASVWYGEPTR